MALALLQPRPAGRTAARSPSSSRSLRRLPPVIGAREKLVPAGQKQLGVAFRSGKAGRDHEAIKGEKEMATVFPVNAEATRENAFQLEKRVAFLRDEVIPSFKL